MTILDENGVVMRAEEPLRRQYNFFDGEPWLQAQPTKMKTILNSTTLVWKRKEALIVNMRQLWSYVQALEENHTKCFGLALVNQFLENMMSSESLSFNY